MSNNLALALHGLQAEMPTLQHDSINPHFKSKYLSLKRLMEQVIPLLNRHGLVWVTLPTYRVDEGDPGLEYRLIHAESGECLVGEMRLLLAKRDPQGQGSAITYARRYSLMAVLGLVADEDDDGNAAVVRQGSPRRQHGCPPDVLKHIRGLIKSRQPKEDVVRLMLTTVGVEKADSTVAAAIKGMTAEQGGRMVALLENYKQGE